MNRESAKLSARARSAGPFALLLALVSVIIITVCGIGSFETIGRPFPGFFVWENLFVPAAGTPSWTGSASGLAYHSWLIEADGRPLHSIEDLRVVLDGKQVGESVEYRARHRGSTYRVSVPVMSFEIGDYFSTTGVFLFNSVVLMTLGLVVLYLKPHDSGARAVFAFSTVQALFLATSIDLFGPYYFRRLYFFFAGLTPVCTLYMLSHFPVARRRRPWESTGLALAFAAAVVFGVFSNIFFFTDSAKLLALDKACHISMAASALAAFAFFSYHFFFARSYSVRQRAKVVLLGSLGAFLPTMVFLILFYTGRVSLAFNFLAVPFVLFPLGIGYAVAKHDLFDVDRVIKRTLVYATLSAAVLALYWAGISLFDAVFEATAAASRAAEGVLILLLILITAPGRRKIQDLVDRIYDRRRYDYRDAVTSAAHSFTTMLDFDRLMESVLRLLDETLQPEMVRLYTIGGDGKPLLHGELRHKAGGSAQINVSLTGTEDGSLMPLAAVLSGKDMLSAEQEHTPDRKTEAALNALRAAEASLAAAMPLENRLVGMLLLGERRAGGPISGDDLMLLRTVADQLAVATENARSYETIGALNQDLEAKNVELERANRELEEAQSELVTKERLAAVGELAGAVAHTIRNPLAGMRASAQQALAELGDHPTRELMDDFVHETDRLNERIEALLDFSRPFEPELQHCTLEEIVAGALHATRAKAAAKNVRVKFLRPPRPTQVKLDPVLFEQLTVELLANALDATPHEGKVVIASGISEERGRQADEMPDGTAASGPVASSANVSPGSVACSLTKEAYNSSESGIAEHNKGLENASSLATQPHDREASPRAWLEVRDSGPGVPKRARADMFRLFFTTKARGTGFGLATVKKIVDRHGGTVTVSDAVEGGACFRVEVPAF